jgi:hypothetical protein
VSCNLEWLVHEELLFFLIKYMSFQSTGLRFLALPRGGGQNLKRSRPGTKPKKLVCAFPQNLGGGNHTIPRFSLLAIDSLRVAPGLTIKEGPVSGEIVTERFSSDKSTRQSLIRFETCTNLPQPDTNWTRLATPICVL